jgi:CRISPR/Cas system-associated exonuclease Cas4 (RecB family)
VIAPTDPAWGQFDIASALENFYDHLAEQAESRPGLHVSDVTGDRGYKCDRFLHFAMVEAETSPAKDRRFIQKRLLLGDAAHRMVYEYIVDALKLAYTSIINITSIEIEEEFVHEATGVIGTPDIVIEGTFVDNGKSFCLVVDVKSLTSWAYENQCTLKAGFRAKPADRRQMLFYVTAKNADMGLFLNIIITRGENEKGQTKYPHNQKYVVPNGSIVDVTIARINAINQLRALDEWGDAVQGSHCNGCKFAEICAATNATLAARGL